MKKRDYSQLLILAALLVTVARYIGAFLMSDLGQLRGIISDVVSVMMGATGAGMGILDVLGCVFIFDGWRKGMPRSGQKWTFRFRVLTVFVFSLFAVGLTILIPFTVARVSQRSMIEVLGIGPALWVWSWAVNIAPYILLGGVVSGQSGVVHVAEISSETQATLPGKHRQPLEKSAARFHKNWYDLSADEKQIIAKLTTAQIVQAYKLSNRTALNWRHAAKKYVDAQLVNID